MKTRTVADLQKENVKGLWDLPDNLTRLTLSWLWRRQETPVARGGRSRGSPWVHSMSDLGQIT